MEVNKVYSGDCLQIMPKFDSKSFDMVLCDLPYGKTRNDWDSILPLDIIWQEYERIIKDEGVILLTASQPFTTDLINSNRKLFRYDLIWYKSLGGGYLNANKMPLRNHEEILVFYKNLPTYNPIMGRGVNKKGIRKTDRNGSNYGGFKNELPHRLKYDDEGKRFPQSVIDISNGDRTKENEHPTQKPTKLFEYLIRTYSNEGALVLDNCAGSGTTGIACIKTNRNYILIEKEPKYVEIINKRIKNELDQFKLAI